MFAWYKFVFTNALRNLWRVPRRTLISLLAIAAGTTAILVFEAFVLGVKTSFRTNIIHSAFGHYKILEKGYLEGRGSEPFGYILDSPNQVKAELEKEFGKLPFLSVRQEFYGLLVNGDVSIAAKGIGAESAQERGYLTMTRVLEGKHLADVGEESIALGAGLAKSLGVKVGDTITLLVNTQRGGMNASDLTVTSLYKSGIAEFDESIFYVHIELATKLLRINSGSELLLGLDVEDELKERPRINKILETHFPGLEAKNWHDILGEYFDNSLKWVSSLFYVMRWILLIIAMLSISNIFTMSVLERTAEWGTLRAMGTFQREIRILILTEAVLQAIIGTLLGIVFAFLVVHLVLRNGIYMPPPPNMNENFFVRFIFPWETLPVTFGLSVIASSLAGLFPAIRVSRLEITSALGRAA